MKRISSLCVSLALALFASCSLPSIAEEEQNYFISESLFTYMHSGPGKQYRIVGSVTSASPVLKLATSDDGEYIQIQDPKGREGWIEAAVLAQGETKEQVVEALKEQVEGLASQLLLEQQAVRQHLLKIDELQQKLDEQQQSVTQAQRERDIIQQELNGYTDELEMKWFVNGGTVAGGGVLLGLLLSFISRKKKRSDRWM